ncbi:MAG: hypothetical protein AAGM22_04330 [Acidobacteriota bacterium]
MRSRYLYFAVLAALLSLFALHPVGAQGFGADDPTLDGGPGGGTIGGGETPIGGGIGGGGTGVLGGDPCIGGGLGGGLGGGACCGDGVCEAGELCAADCAACGDGVCNQNESCATCIADCGSCGFCGDGICSGLESCATCSDCSSCFPTAFQAFYRGRTGETLRTAFSHSGSSWTGDGVLGNGAASKRGPAAVKFNDRLFVFYRGNRKDEIYVTWSDDGQTWSGNRRLGNGAETDDGVTATVFNNRIYVFSRGESQDSIWISSSSNGFTWSSADHYPIVTNLQTNDGPPTAVTFDGKMEVWYARNQTSTASVSSSDGVNWVAGPVIHNPVEEGVALAVFDDTLYLAYATTRSTPDGSGGFHNDHRRLLVRTKAVGGEWSEDGIWILGAKTDRRPALAAGETRLVLLYKGVQTDDLFWSYTADGENWFGDLRAVGQTEEGGPALVYTD